MLSPELVLIVSVWRVELVCSVVFELKQVVILSPCGDFNRKFSVDGIDSHLVAQNGLENWNLDVCINVFTVKLEVFMFFHFDCQKQVSW